MSSKQFQMRPGAPLIHLLADDARVRDWSYVLVSGQWRGQCKQAAGAVEGGLVELALGEASQSNHLFPPAEMYPKDIPGSLYYPGFLLWQPP